MMTSRVSSAEWTGPSKIRAKGSSKTEIDSMNVTRCFLKFDRALFSSHPNAGGIVSPSRIRKGKREVQPPMSLHSNQQFGWLTFTFVIDPHRRARLRESIWM